VFQALIGSTHSHWPAYDTEPLYSRDSTAGLQSDIRVISREWFREDSHDSIGQFLSHLPLAYFDFAAHDRYGASTTYDMESLFRVFLFKHVHGWEHETDLLEFFRNHPTLRADLGLKSVPDQSTLWRSWHERFSPDLREAVESGARAILYKADDGGVAVPREPEKRLASRANRDSSAPDDEAILERASTVSEEVAQLVFPTFFLDRGQGCEIHENAFWDLQTYLGLRENLAVNEGARSFLVESTRERTPLGHAHREHLRDLSVPNIRRMYRDAIGRLVDRVAETEAFYRAGIVAIDITEADPFTGDRSGHEDEIIGTKEESDEYAYQWATVQLVGNAVPLVLDARPVRKGEARLKIVEELLDSAQELVHVDKVLMDREFDSQHVLEEIAARGLIYAVPKRMYTSEKAQAKRLLRRGEDRYTTDRKLYLGNNEWHETTLCYRRNENSEHDDHRQYAVFMTNSSAGAITEYAYRWEIERGYRSIKRFMAATTSKNFVLRFFYFAFACLLCSIWRAVDLLVQVDLMEEYERSPMVTADNTLTLVKKQTGIG
jgi:IS4 transposase